MIRKARIGPVNALVLSVPDSAEEDSAALLGFECMQSTLGVFTINQIWRKPKRMNWDLRSGNSKDGRREIVPPYPFGRLVPLNQYELD